MVKQFFVPRELKRVIAHSVVNTDASGDANGNYLGAERDALFRGIAARYWVR